MPSVDQTAPRPRTGKTYWRSLEDFADTPEFREFMFREFPAGASEMLDSTQRREFLKIMGASLALAGMGISGCRRWPEEKIAPYASRPAGRLPGIPNSYATSMELGGVASGLLVTSYDGRPIKIEGNPEHPINRGATDAWAQASVLELYDPDRSRHVMHNNQASSWDNFSSWAKSHFAALREADGNGLCILSEATASPSVLDMKRRLLEAMPNAKWYEYEPLNNDNELAGSILAFGSPYRAQYHFDRAKIIVSLDSDFLHAHPAAVKYTRDFASGRRADDAPKTMNRLYVVESGYSLTGANADHRVAVRSGDIGAVAGHLAKMLSSAAANWVGSVDVAKPMLQQMVDDLASHRGECLIVVGPRQPGEVHAIAHLLNEELGNVGRTVSYTARPDAKPQAASIKALAADIDGGEVDTLVILGGNPAYNAPADLDFASKLGSVGATIHVSSYADETSKRCTWHLPRSHYLESWGDARAYDGTIGITQPLIEPLFGGRSPIELLAIINGDDVGAGYDIVRRSFGGVIGDADFERHWRRVLHDGFVADSAFAEQSPTVRSDEAQTWIIALARLASQERRGLELVFTGDRSVYDGRFANNGWLQELPDPLTKLTWDNAVQISPSAAENIGVKMGDMVNVSLQGGSHVEAAVLVMPGQHAQSATLTLGYGRNGVGRIAEDAGFDFYQLRSSDSMGFVGGATITKSSGSYEFALTQHHHALDTIGGKGTQDRLPTIFREANLDEYKEHPDFADHRVHVAHRLSLWDESNLDNADYKWAMSIDLTTCTGCSACVVACQAENNIPIVGKDQVKRGREMHWIRVDRYFSGSNPETPDSVAMQPVPCMHCENAACEEVCPVAATTHDRDGLNVMVYNRCIGTRYCSNNCPYKVRRFNFFDYQVREPVRETGLMHVKPSYYTRPQSDTHPLQQLQHNPEVTIRSRGVMEKCTYCIQRISAGKIKAKNDWVKAKPEDRSSRVTVPDGSVVPACAQACPAQAIVFGDLADPNSRVAKLHAHERTYEMLEELNPKPRTRYMAKLRNPAPSLAPAAPSSQGSAHG